MSKIFSFYNGLPVVDYYSSSIKIYEIYLKMI
jgi:hypothetical protein